MEGVRKMKIEYTMDEETYLDLSYIIHKKLRSKWALIVGNVVPSILILSIPFISRIPITEFERYYIWILIAAVFPVLSTVYEKFLIKIRTKRTINMSKNGALGDKTIYLSDTGIKICMDSYEIFVKWDLVREIYCKDEYIIIISSLVSIPIVLKDIDYSESAIVSKINEYMSNN